METEKLQFRLRFEEHLENGGYTKFCLPDQETYQDMIDQLSGAVSEKHRSLYYLRKKFEIMEVGGLQKIIKVSLKYCTIYSLFGTYTVHTFTNKYSYTQTQTQTHRLRHRLCYKVTTEGNSLLT